MIAYFIQSHPSNIKYTLVVVFPKAPGWCAVPTPRPGGGRGGEGRKLPCGPGATAAAAGGAPDQCVCDTRQTKKNFAIVHIHFTFKN